MVFFLVSEIIFAGGFMFCLLLEDEVSNCENFGKNDAHHVVDGGLLRHHRTASMTDNSYVPSRLRI